MVKILSIGLVLTVIFAGAMIVCREPHHRIVLARGGGSGTDPVLDILTGKVRRKQEKPKDRNRGTAGDPGKSSAVRADSKPR